MNWYRENRWLGNFLIAFAVTALLAFWFLFRARSGFTEASAQFNAAATDGNSLEHVNPISNAGTCRKQDLAADAAPAVVERAIVDLTSTASPSAMRKVLNQTASGERQFFIVRTLYVRNQQLKGPHREQTAATAATTPPPASAIKFIV